MRAGIILAVLAATASQAWTDDANSLFAFRGWSPDGTYYVNETNHLSLCPSRSDVRPTWSPKLGAPSADGECISVDKYQSYAEIPGAPKLVQSATPPKGVKATLRGKADEGPWTLALGQGKAKLVKNYPYMNVEILGWKPDGTALALGLTRHKGVDLAEYSVEIVDLAARATTARPRRRRTPRAWTCTGSASGATRWTSSARPSRPTTASSCRTTTWPRSRRSSGTWRPCAASWVCCRGRATRTPPRSSTRP